MSKAVPHFSEQCLAEYRKRLAQGRPQVLKDPDVLPDFSADLPGEGDWLKDSLPPGFKADLAREQDLEPHRPKSRAAVPVRPSEGRQTKTEERYNREVLGGLGRFEAVSLRLPGGGRYTPDFMTIDDGQVTFHEVKGSYRLGSQGRAYTAFHDAAAYYPMWRFVWAHWTGKAWEVRKFAGTV